MKNATRKTQLLLLAISGAAIAINCTDAPAAPTALPDPSRFSGGGACGDVNSAWTLTRVGWGQHWPLCLHACELRNRQANAQADQQCKELDAYLLATATPDAQYRVGQVCSAACPGFPSDPIPSKPTMEWTITDVCNDGKEIQYRFFHRDNSRTLKTWPSTSRVYVARQFDTPYTHTLQLDSGDRICYGAAMPGSNYYWGIGLDGDQGCDDCCYTARPGLVTAGKRLTCPGR